MCFEIWVFLILIVYFFICCSVLRIFWGLMNEIVWLICSWCYWWKLWLSEIWLDFVDVYRLLREIINSFYVIVVEEIKGRVVDLDVVL